MDKKMILAIALSMLILFMWPIVFKTKKPVETEKTKETAVIKVEEQKLQDKKDYILVDAKPKGKEKIYSLENELVKIDLSSKGSVIKQVVFKSYKDEKGNPIRFFGDRVKNKGAFQIVGLEDAYFKLVSKTENELLLEYRDSKHHITTEYKLDVDSYVLRSNIKAGGGKVMFRLLTATTEDSKSRYGLASNPEERNKEYLVFSAEIERDEITELKEKGPVSFDDKIQWLGITDRYFLFSILGGEHTFSNVVSKYIDDSTYAMEFGLEEPLASFDYTMFIGPKDVALLRQLDPNLAEAIDYGMLAVISVPMLELMKFFYGIIPNYGIAILILTLFVRLLMYPLQHKSMKSMKRMQELQPHIKKLQAKYKDNKEALNKEMMQFMKTHKVNPMGGCFPMLLQLPVFIALYKVLANAVELYRSPFIFWLTDLSAKDPYYVLPILMGIMMFLQQKLTPNPTMDPSQAKMMMLMPVVFTFFMISLPSGLTLYIMFSTFLGIVQQYVMNRQKQRST